MRGCSPISGDSLLIFGNSFDEHGSPDLFKVN